MAKYLAQVVILGAQVIGRAFARALQQEFTATSAAATARNSNGKPGDSRTQRMANIKHSMTLQEARDILNVDELEREKIEQAFKHLFDANDKAKGGSFYIQSKVVRAKERLDEELQTKSDTSKKNQNADR